MNENVRGQRTRHPREVELVVFDSAAEIDTKKETESLIEIHEDFKRTKSADNSSVKEGSNGQRGTVVGYIRRRRLDVSRCCS